MVKGLGAFAAAAALLSIAATADAQQSADPRIADLVAAGRVRFGTFPPQYTKDTSTGELKGPWVEAMRALGGHMGLSVVFTEVTNPRRLIECLSAGQCEVASLGFDPTRDEQRRGFTRPRTQTRRPLSGAYLL